MQNAPLAKLTSAELAVVRDRVDATPPARAVLNRSASVAEALDGLEQGGFMAEAMRLLVSKVDPTQADAGLAAYQDYIAAETAADKKVKAQVAAAQMLLDTGQGAKAAEEFRKILATNPDNIDAELGLGLALFSTGEKANFQEAANHLQRVIEKAPDTHPLKQSAKESLDYLKSQENVKPEKTSSPARRRG